MNVCIGRALSLALDPNGQRDHAIRIEASLVWAHFAFVTSWIVANKHLTSNTVLLIDERFYLSTKNFLGR